MRIRPSCAGGKKPKPETLNPWALLGRSLCLDAVELEPLRQHLQACILYLQSFLKECVTLPPDYISTLSFFFPVFPAYDAAVALSCLEFFLEWKYFPDFKLWTPIVVLGCSSALEVHFY